MKEKRNLYEGMFIVSPTLSDDARSKALERVKKEITDRGGEIMKEHDMGRKRLAYEVDGHREGYYYLFYFEVNAEAITDIWKEWHLNEDLIRFMTTRTEKVLESLEFKALAEPQ